MRRRQRVHRTAGRVLLIDGEGRVLLFLGHDPETPGVAGCWYAPGGGCEAGESRREAAARELLEETGIAVQPETLGHVVHRRTARFCFDGDRYLQRESYYVARTPTSQIDTSGLRGVEAEAIVAHRWWSWQELMATAATVYPEGLAELLRDAWAMVSGRGTARRPRP